MKKLLLCLSLCGIINAGNFDDLAQSEIQADLTAAREGINRHIDHLFDQAYDKGTKTPRVRVAQIQNVVKIPVFARVRTYEASDFNGNTFPAKNCLITFGTSDKTDNLHAIQSYSHSYKNKIGRWTGVNWSIRLMLFGKKNPDEDLYFKMKEIAHKLTESESPQQIGVVLIPRDQIGSIEEYRSNQTPATVLENHFSQQFVLNTIPEFSKDLSNYPPLPKNRALEILDYLESIKLIGYVDQNKLATLIYWASKPVSDSIQEELERRNDPDYKHSSPTKPMADRVADIVDREYDARRTILSKEQESWNDLQLKEFLSSRKANDKDLLEKTRSREAELTLMLADREHQRFMKAQAKQLAAARSLSVTPPCRFPLPH